MPGVRAILTGDEVPGPRDQINDNGQVIRANPRSETALATEAMYQGQPVLAVCAESELIAAEAIERIEIEWEPLPFNVDPVASLMPGAQDARLEGRSTTSGRRSRVTRSCQRDLPRARPQRRFRGRIRSNPTSRCGLASRRGLWNGVCDSRVF